MHRVCRNKIGLAVLQLLETGDLLKLKKKWWLDKGECPVDVDSKVISRYLSPTDGNKKLSRCWDSATCEPLDADVIAAEVQNSTFFHTPVVFLCRVWITGYYDTNGPMLICSFPFLLHYVIAIHLERQTNVMPYACHAKVRFVVIVLFENLQSSNGEVNFVSRWNVKSDP